MIELVSRAGRWVFPDLVGKGEAGRQGGWLIVPLLQVLWLSISEPQFGAGNYLELLTNPALLHMPGVTAKVSAMVTAISLVLGYVVAYVMVHVNSRHSAFLESPPPASSSSPSR